MKESRKLAVIGSGPTGLMAATQASLRGSFEISVYERRPGLGRKLLVAGSSGLNISSGLPLLEIAEHYSGFDLDSWTRWLEHFGPKEWISFIERELGLETFLGTSDRYFVREMKASRLLQAWRAFLEQRGVRFFTQHDLESFECTEDQVRMEFRGQPEVSAHHVIFSLGGGSWEDEAPKWPELFRHRGIGVEPFSSSNVGYEVGWSPGFLTEAEGKPLKSISLRTTKGSKRGDLMITRYGLEGTPVYFLGETGPSWIDLKPEWSETQILEKLKSVKENLSPVRRAKLYFSETTLSLLFHHGPEAARRDLGVLASTLKNFPVDLLGPRPLAEAISSRGGVSLDEVDSDLRLKKFPRISCAGEMLAWDAPTGGFLIQACVSQGAWAARGASESGRVVTKIKG